MRARACSVATKWCADMTYMQPSRMPQKFDAKTKWLPTAMPYIPQPMQFVQISGNGSGFVSPNVFSRRHFMTCQCKGEIPTTQISQELAPVFFTSLLHHTCANGPKASPVERTTPPYGAITALKKSIPAPLRNPGPLKQEYCRRPRTRFEYWQARDHFQGSPSMFIRGRSLKHA